ncbi:hypothetical protein BH09PSE2_BH09PSE2_03820 [soil metagenome]
MRLFALLSTAGTLALALSAAASAPTQTPPGKGEGCHAGGAVPAASTKPDETPGLLAHLGSGGYAAEGVSDAARPYFEQGVRLFHTFDAPNAIRSFKEAQARQPDCAMCFWGEAWARGPTINYPVDAKGEGLARTAALKAQSLQKGLSDKARRLIAAQVARYPATPRKGDAASDDQTYADVMEMLSQRFPDDYAVVVETASALLIASGKAWGEGAYTAESPSGRARANLERVLARSPDFTPAIHYYIHLMEWSHAPDNAAPYAERMAKLAPDAGHLIHMPSHLWFRMGRYDDGARANIAAARADDVTARVLKVDGGAAKVALHGHNLSFGLGSAMMSGNGAESRLLARRVLAEYPDDSRGVLVKGYQAFAREAPLADTLALSEPKAVMNKAAWRYARGLAQAWAGNGAAAQAESDALKALKLDAKAEKKERDGKALMQAELDGRIALAQGRLKDAIPLLRRAATLRDSFDTSLDPPFWAWSPRRALGVALLQSGDAKAAARELDAVVKRYPGDPLTLFALAEARRKAGDGSGADKALTAAKAGWKGGAEGLTLARA